MRRASAKLRPLKHSYREFVEWQSELLAGNDETRAIWRTGGSKSKMRRTFSIFRPIIPSGTL